jgi:EmrB/QacA subfamily drug resistance transporter
MTQPETRGKVTISDARPQYVGSQGMLIHKRSIVHTRKRTAVTFAGIHSSMKTPCDEAAIRSGNSQVPCPQEARPWILAATILASSMAFIDSTVVNVAIPALQANLHASIVDVQWVVESYALFLSALILVGGVLGDRYGRRLLFLSGVMLFAAASIGCGLSANIRQLVIARSIQGIGAALLVPESLAIISASFDEKSRGKAIGTWSAFTAITTALGPVVGGWLIQHASWRWAFFINVPLAAAVFLIALRRIPETRSATVKRVDWLGAAIAIVGLGGIVNGFVESANLGWPHPVVLASLIVGSGCLIIFVFIEARVSAPMVPLELFSSSSFSGANLLTFFLYAALGIFFFIFPMSLIQVHGFSTTKAAAAALPMIALMSSLSRWSGGLVDRYGARIPLVIGPLIAAAGFALFAATPAGGSYWKTFFPGFVVLGLGMAITVAPLTTVVMTSVDQDHAGTASGINNAVARVAGVLAIAVFGVVMVASFSSHLDHSLANFPLPSGAVREIQTNETRLAALNLPTNLDRNTASAVRSAISHAFLAGFRLVMLVCTALAVASGVLASRLITSDNKSQG